VANNLVSSTLPKALADNKLNPVNQPSVEPLKFEIDAAFAYKARFEVQPEIAEVKFEGIELSRPVTDVTDEMVEKQLQALQVRHATLKVPEPIRASKEGDVLTIDFKLHADGEELKDGGGEGIAIELGSNQVVPELSTGLAGKNEGDTFEISAKLAETHPRTEMRGKVVVFKGAVKAVKERMLPNLDDEFAKDVGPFQTLVELRANVHTAIGRSLKDQSDTMLAEQIVAKLNELNPTEVPHSLVEQQCRLMEQEIAMQARRMGQNLSREQIQAVHGRVHAEAERKVRAGLVMAEIAKRHEIKVTDEDIEKGLEELAQETGKNVAKMRVEYRDPQKRNMLIGMILEDKVLDLIEAKAKIADAPAGASPTTTP
jgi:trigger factor